MEPLVDIVVLYRLTTAGEDALRVRRLPLR